MKPFTESLRYDYDLTAADVVIDAGCYEGRWAAEMSQRYGCTVHAFEPVPDFFHRCLVAFQNNPRVHVRHLALGDRIGLTQIGVNGDSSGMFNASASRQVEVPTTTLQRVLAELELKEIAVLKLNVEGAEFPILEHALDNGYIAAFREIQVQPHHIAPDSEQRWAKILDRLSRSHETTFAEPWCWFGLNADFHDHPQQLFR
jgi:FkbM family methyltransferase